MPEEKKVNHLTVFLIKKQYTEASQVVKGEDCDDPIDVAIAGYGSGKLFVKKTPPRPPRWSELFEQHVDPGAIAVRGVSAVFFIKLGDRCFALAFGQGGRFLLRDEIPRHSAAWMCDRWMQSKAIHVFSLDRRRRPTSLA
jgi:uncharacterized protein (TIGR04141 family)